MFQLASKSEEASALREMVDKLQEERVGAASEAESAKRRTGEVERSFDLVETEKLGLERSVVFSYPFEEVVRKHAPLLLCSFASGFFIVQFKMWHVLLHTAYNRYRL